ncbi:uncharacterized protein RCC_05100 [Ramularia collo-cygni]|uniref:Uncharacterized protein n=1 Tax=Ramularia collo-cygni TaxID=112498 RepID=A0A2D3V9F5_9PEZI|nr:uncharacterized protein RCC_05100 [Ramularia collo-cygni]CZT19254.1 uncharacterized protein RCC_05100 [Ramularia collo-cygni]
MTASGSIVGDFDLASLRAMSNRSSNKAPVIPSAQSTSTGNIPATTSFATMTNANPMAPAIERSSNTTSSIASHNCRSITVLPNVKSSCQTAIFAHPTFYTCIDLTVFNWLTRSGIEPKFPRAGEFKESDINNYNTFTAEKKDVLRR